MNLWQYPVRIYTVLPEQQDCFYCLSGFDEPKGGQLHTGTMESQSVFRLQIRSFSCSDRGGVFFQGYFRQMGDLEE